MNEDADTDRWEDECPNWMSVPTGPKGAAGSNFEHVRRAEAVPAFLR
jgi:hypothetical protein